MRNATFFALIALSTVTLAQEQTQSLNDVYVVPDPDHPWAAAQIGAALLDTVTYHEGSLLQALSLAQSGKAKGVVEIKIDSKSLWETGRVVCYSPNGKKLWEETVFANFGGGQEGIARKFADRLEKKVAGKRCPSAT